ncbi:lanthionine synthetase C family protein [Streptomyces sp. RY43-2]|uniref:Lanthionine synthetase C family protein n=1 Tax=Streptomyces macrolidinus TaxID=2952607 RepID=A0ABT0ZAD1_9ACTN|nr:lanthionine synthetase C family protein [Streptomyces macrolidinus]MCN9240729.1 lanthionine synthetase C family protein [Streptomyces macrolidinus]
MNAPTGHRADVTGAVARFAQQLAQPETPSPDEPWMAQSLGKGAPGVALLHIERAHTGHGTWQQAHAWIAAAVASEISAADTAGLYLGAPAIAFVLHAANASSDARYRDALKPVDAHVAALAHRRTDAAMARIQRGELSTFREYDLLYGLTGIGTYLLRSDPQGSALERILDYLVALTRPLRADGRELPGWWVGHDPHFAVSPHFPGGHGNLGTAHGITGPLLLLSQAMRRGITVEGQHEAIEVICAWLGAWRQDGDSGPWWPEHVTLAGHRTGRTRQTGPTRPSWCYDTPGIARAGQLAGIATDNLSRQRSFEYALHRCLTDPAQVALITDDGLCHGRAGVLQTAWRAARDAVTPILGEVLPHLVEALVHHAEPGTDHGFLEGNAGVALALTTAAADAAPTSGWDTCLLID